MVENVGFHQVMWFVMLESTKDRILRVDTLGQHVPPCARYGMACLLIRYAIGCVPCSVEWGWHHTLISLCDILCEPLEPHGARRDVCAGSLSTAGGDCLFAKL
jgi:hypothetical protein